MSSRNSHIRVVPIIIPTKISTKILLVRTGKVFQNINENGWAFKFEYHQRGQRMPFYHGKPVKTINIELYEANIEFDSLAWGIMTTLHKSNWAPNFYMKLWTFCTIPFLILLNFNSCIQYCAICFTTLVVLECIFCIPMHIMACLSYYNSKWPGRSSSLWCIMRLLGTTTQQKVAKLQMHLVAGTLLTTASIQTWILESIQTWRKSPHWIGVMRYLFALRFDHAKFEPEFFCLIVRNFTMVSIGAWARCLRSWGIQSKNAT